MCSNIMFIVSLLMACLPFFIQLIAFVSHLFAMENKPKGTQLKLGQFAAKCFAKGIGAAHAVQFSSLTERQVRWELKGCIYVLSQSQIESSAGKL